MRAWHLVGLPAPDGERLTFAPHDSETPLLLPSTITAGDHEQIIAFYQQVLTPDPLPRVEIDWYSSGLDPGPRRVVEGVRMRRGSSSTLLVIKVRVEGVDAEALLADPIAKMFQHTVVASTYPLANPRLGNLAALTRHVELTLRALYDEMSMELELKHPWTILRPLMSALLNPVDVVECFNSLVDLQLEAHVTDEPVPALKARLLSRLLAARTRDEVLVLCAHIKNTTTRTREHLGSRWDAAFESLSKELLLSHGELRGWASWLSESDIERARNDSLRATRSTSQSEQDWLYVLDKILAPPETPEAAEHRELAERIAHARELTNAQKLARAGDELNALEPRIQRETVPPAIQADFYQTLGGFYFSERRYSEALVAYERALSIRLADGIPANPYGIIHLQMAFSAERLGDLERAVRAMRQSIQEESPPGGYLAISLRNDLQNWLRKLGRIEEAEEVAREIEALKK